jgi:hypothetical protein
MNVHPTRIWPLVAPIAAFFSVPVITQIAGAIYPHAMEWAETYERQVEFGRWISAVKGLALFLPVPVGVASLLYLRMSPRV